MLSLPTPPKCFAASVLATLHAAFAHKREARPSGFSTFGAIWVHCITARQLARHPFQMALSIGFRMLSFLPSCYSSYGAWTLTPVGLSPTVHANLRWTHTFTVPYPETTAVILPGNRDLVPLPFRDRSRFLMTGPSSRANGKKIEKHVPVMGIAYWFAVALSRHFTEHVRGHT